MKLKTYKIPYNGLPSSSIVRIDGESLPLEPGSCVTNIVWSAGFGIVVASCHDEFSVLWSVVPDHDITVGYTPLITIFYDDFTDGDQCKPAPRLSRVWACFKALTRWLWSRLASASFSLRSSAFKLSEADK